MIKTFANSATRQFVETGKSKFSGLDEARARRRISSLRRATALSDLSPLHSVGLHKLTGDRKGYWAMTINGPWRLVFRFRTVTPMTSRSSTTTERKTEMIEAHPGEILKEELEIRGLSANRLALALRVPSGRVTEILNGKRAVTPDTALRLARFFGNSAEFWLGLQAGYELSVAEQEHGARISAEVQPADDKAA